MPTFGRTSERELATSHPELQRLFREVVKHWDCTILEGHRSLERQAELYAKGLTKLKAGGRHNANPSLAVDVAPWFAVAPHIHWGDIRAFYAFGGFVLGVAQQMGIPIRWGGDWNMNRVFDDQRFIDAPHFELIGTAGG